MENCPLIADLSRFINFSGEFLFQNSYAKFREGICIKGTADTAPGLGQEVKQSPLLRAHTSVVGINKYP